MTLVSELDLPSFDHTLRLARIAFDGAGGRRVAAGGPVWGAVQRALDLALVALAGEQAGGSRKVAASCAACCGKKANRPGASARW